MMGMFMKTREMIVINESLHFKFFKLGIHLCPDLYVKACLVIVQEVWPRDPDLGVCNIIW